MVRARTAVIKLVMLCIKHVMLHMFATLSMAMRGGVGTSALRGFWRSGAPEHHFRFVRAVPEAGGGGFRARPSTRSCEVGAGDAPP